MNPEQWKMGGAMKFSEKEAIWSILDMRDIVAWRWTRRRGEASWKADEYSLNKMWSR